MIGGPTSTAGDPARAGVDDPVRYQGSVPATEEEMIEWAARNNPITDVEIE